MRYSEIKEKEITEIEDIGELSYGKGWQKHKQYFIKPKEIIRKNNFIMVIGSDERYNSKSLGWFDPSKYEKEKGKPFPTIKSMREINNPDLRLASVLEVGKPSTKGGRTMVVMVGTEPEYQGKGLAFDLYSYVIDNFGTLYSDSKQSPAGRGMWVKLLKSGKYNMGAENVKTGERAPINLDGNQIKTTLDLEDKNVHLYAEKK